MRKIPFPLIMVCIVLMSCGPTSHYYKTPGLYTPKMQHAPVTESAGQTAGALSFFYPGLFGIDFEYRATPNIYLAANIINSFGQKNTINNGDFTQNFKNSQF